MSVTSATVGMSGKAGERVWLEIAIARVFLLSSNGLASSEAENIICALPAARSCAAWAPPR